MSFDQKDAPFIERLVFNNRLVVVVLFTLVSLFLGYPVSRFR